MVSAWEIAIKRALGKLEAPDDLEASIRMQGFEPLLMTFHHAAQAGGLPPHHGDPFDRMLIAQAQAEGLILVIRPLDKGGDPWVESNLQCLCRGCHIEKTRAENRRPLTAAESAWRELVTELSGR